MITITRPLAYDSVEEFKLTCVELSKDSTKLILTGTDDKDIPVRCITYVGNSVAEEIVYGAIFGQFKDYRKFETGKEAFEALKNHYGDKLQVKLIKEKYEDPLTGVEHIGTRTLLNPADF